MLKKPAREDDERNVEEFVSERLVVENRGARQARSQSILEVAGVLLVFFLLGGGPAPEVNEAHYLAKARHFWDPQFCHLDHFLNSGDGHFGFFFLFGWIAHVLPFTAAAWVGRLSAWALLAWAWQRLSFALVPVRGVSILSAGAWGVFIHYGQMSGEWVFGGWEAKVFAYGFVLLGLGDLVVQRWGRAGLWMGIASALHVLVGGWAWIVMALVGWLEPKEQRPSLGQWLPGWMAGLACASIGLIPALQLQSGVPAGTAQAANQIYVWGRLSHHLLLRAFPQELVLRHILLIAIFMTLWCQRPRGAAATRLGRMVFGAVILAMVGAVIDAIWGGEPRGAKLLRFYWFRMSDVFVPLGVSLLGLAAFRAKAADYPRAIKWAAAVVTLGLLGHVVQSVRAELGRPMPRADRQGAITTAIQWRDWKDACEWMRLHAPSDAVVLTPFDHQTFKWYAHRAEVVTNKDVPQDARGLVAWWHRLSEVKAWYASTTEEESARRAAKLVEEFDADYVLLRNVVLTPQVPASFEVVYQNPSYRVYLVPTPSNSTLPVGDGR